MFKPYVGQKVKLSRQGFQRLKLDSEDAFQQAMNMTVTHVEDINAGSGCESIWVIQVNQPAINRFMLCGDDVVPI